MPPGEIRRVRTPEENRAYQQARRRAMQRMIAAYPEVWAALLQEELRHVGDDPRYAGAFKDREPKVRIGKKVDTWTSTQQ